MLSAAIFLAILDDPIAHKDGVKSAAFSPSGKMIASGGWDSRVKVWDVNGRLINKFQGPANNSVTGVSWSPDGNSVATSWSDGKVRIFSPILRKATVTFGTGTSYLSGINYAADGKSLYVSGYDNLVKKMSLSGTVLTRFKGLPSDAYCMDLSGKYVVGGGPESIVVWQQARPITSRKIDVVGNVGDVQFIEGGKKVAAVTLGTSIKVFDTATGEESGSYQGQDVWTARFSSDSKKVAVGDRTGAVRLFNYPGFDGEKVLLESGAGIAAISWNKAGTYFVTGDDKGHLLLWDTVGAVKKRAFSE